MARGELEFHVRRPPADVFAVLADLGRATEWVPDLVSIEQTTPGEVGVGTRYREVVRLGGKTSEAELEVTEYDPPRVFAHDGRGGPSTFSATFTLEADGDGTRVTHAYAIELSGPMRIMGPMIKGWVRKNAETAHANLVRLLEGEEA
jgi:carbon monoxide dehydrogenase subunit G